MTRLKRKEQSWRQMTDHEGYYQGAYDHGALPSWRARKGMYLHQLTRIDTVDDSYPPDPKDHELLASDFMAETMQRRQRKLRYRRRAIRKWGL